MTEKILNRANGTFISYEYIAGQGNLTLLYLHGFQSSKQSEKTNWIKQIAQQNQIGYLSLDYTAHGNSSGKPIDFRIGQCLTDVLDVINAVVQTPIIVIGSSLGGWLSFLLAERLKERIRGIIAMAPAVDFMQDIWKGYLNDELRAYLQSGKTIEASAESMNAPWNYEMFQEAEQHLLLSKGIYYNGPVVLIHGDADTTIPYQKSLQIKDALTTDDVNLHILKGYTHRLIDEKCRYLFTFELERLIKEVK